MKSKDDDDGPINGLKCLFYDMLSSKGSVDTQNLTVSWCQRRDLSVGIVVRSSPSKMFKSLAAYSLMLSRKRSTPQSKIQTNRILSRTYSAGR